MTLRYPQDMPHGGWVFYLLIGKQEVKLQASSLSQLTESVRMTLQRNGLPALSPEDLSTVVQHQICLRQPNPKESCFSSGLGDDLHHRFVAPVIDWIQRTVSAKTGRRIKGLDSVKGCSGCKGTTVYDPSLGLANTGRAGALNSVLPHPQ